VLARESFGLSLVLAHNALLAGLKRRRRRRASGIIAGAAVVAGVCVIVPALTGARSATPAPATPTGTPIVYVANGPPSTGWVTPISTVTNTAGPRINVGINNVMAATPNGKTIYVLDQRSDTVIPVSTATNTAGPPIKVADFPFAITFTPDGKIAYVQSENSQLTPIMTATKHGRPADHDQSCERRERRLARDHARRKDHLFPRVSKVTSWSRSRPPLISRANRSSSPRRRS
jgi:YVTN family beta-propeller protein